MRQPRIALVATLALVCAASAWGLPQAELVLHFIEIGQGDCTLIECPNGGFILVDAGSTAHGDRDAVRDYVRDQLDQASPRITMSSSSTSPSLSRSPGAPPGIRHRPGRMSWCKSHVRRLLPMVPALDDRHLATASSSW